MESKTCPVCGSSRYETITATSTFFQFLRDRRCLDCNTVWRPRCPKSAAFVTIITGAALFCLFGWFLVYGLIGGEFAPGQGNALQLMISVVGLLGGAGAVVYGIRVLLGREGALKVLSEGTPPAEPSDAAAKEQRPARPKRQVRWYHFCVAILLPFVAMPWGLVHILREKWKSGFIMLALSALTLAVFIYIVVTVTGR